MKHYDHDLQNISKLKGKRILVCGKGGSGKSSIVALMAKLLSSSTSVFVIDGDASNPNGVGAMLCSPIPRVGHLLEFFGGRDRVECPLDNPTPLTRPHNTHPIKSWPLILEEIPMHYKLMISDNLHLFQVGKISRAFEGCAGAMSKITRDFLFEGDHISLIDVEGGIEHFGRGMEENIDIVLCVIDPTRESISLAHRIKKLSTEMGIKNTFCILNKVRSTRVEEHLINQLRTRKILFLGTLWYDETIEESSLEGEILSTVKTYDDLIQILAKMIEFSAA